MVFARASFPSLAGLALLVISTCQAETSGDWVPTNVTDASIELLNSALRTASAYGPNKFMCTLEIVSVYTKVSSSSSKADSSDLSFDSDPENSSGINYKFTAGACSVDVAENAGPCPDSLSCEVYKSNFFVFSQPITETVNITSIEAVVDPPTNFNFD